MGGFSVTAYAQTQEGQDDEGENTVHFLNQVDKADLMALMEDGESKT